jgi:protein-tyrosine phosphatase
MFSAVQTLYSEIAPNLFMGGTDDDDVIHFPQQSFAPRKDLPFDSIVTMYAWARPADWHVQEFRYGIPDAGIEDIDLKRLKQAVEWGYQQWMSGDRVLVRCQAGLNRSGLVTALIMVKSGLDAESAIAQIRTHRADYALCNGEYEAWLLAEGEAFVNASRTHRFSTCSDSEASK